MEKCRGQWRWLKKCSSLRWCPHIGIIKLHLLFQKFASSFKSIKTLNIFYAKSSTRRQNLEKVKIVFYNLIFFVWLIHPQYYLGMQFWSGDLYICLGYSMYTWEGQLFPFPFPFVHTKVTPPPHQFCCLSSLFPNCIQNDVTSQRLSLSVGFKKPRPILLISAERIQFLTIQFPLTSWATRYPEPQQNLWLA